MDDINTARPHPEFPGYVISAGQHPNSDPNKPALTEEELMHALSDKPSET